MTRAAVTPEVAAWTDGLPHDRGRAVQSLVFHLDVASVDQSGAYGEVLSQALEIVSIPPKNCHIDLELEAEGEL